MPNDPTQIHDPSPILQTAFGFWASKVLLTAVEMGVFTKLGARVFTIGAGPDGRNINLNCGSLHLDSLRETVLRERAELGVAFDGDADRALFVSGSGKMVDGDAVLLITARHLKSQDKLPGDVVVNLTTSSVIDDIATAHGRKVYRTPVGEANNSGPYFFFQ